MQLSALLVTIGLNPGGDHKYPDFDQIQAVKDKNIITPRPFQPKWPIYIDTFGRGWVYDQVSGHKHDGSSLSNFPSPFGVWLGVILAPAEFVDQAVQLFPNDCRKLSETEMQNFYDNRGHINDPDELIDLPNLQGIKLKMDLGLKLTPQQESAIDPKSKTFGIRPNPDKIWVTSKLERDIQLI